MPWVSQEWFNRQLSVLQRMEGKLDKLLNLGRTNMAKIDDDLARLKSQVQQVNDTEDSAVTLIQGLIGQLRNAQQQPDIGSAVSDIINGLQQHQQPLAAAVASGSASTPQPTPAPTSSDGTPIQ